MWIPPGLALAGVGIWTLAALLSDQRAAAGKFEAAQEG